MSPTYRPRNAICAALVALCLIHCNQPATAQENVASETTTLARQWTEHRQREFEEYEFAREGAAPAALKMESRPVLNWTNPERGVGHGGLFLWTDAGRPQMIACAFEFGGSVKHEFHSLSTDAIAAERGGAKVHRFGPGIEWQPLPESPKPAAQRSLRLTQMRRQAERFRVIVGDKELAETRLLPRPVFRSAATLAEDLAVFVFVQGTDPECTLLVEALPDKEWRYALARQTKWALQVELDGKNVWERRANHSPQADPQTAFLVLAQKAGTGETP